jgi:hypothetical protein
MKTLTKIIFNLSILLILPILLYFAMMKYHKRKYNEKNLEIIMLDVENAKLKREADREAAREAALRADLEAAREAAREAYERDAYERRPLAQPPSPF